MAMWRSEGVGRVCGNHLALVCVLLMLMAGAHGARHCYNDLHRVIQENHQWLGQVETSDPIVISGTDSGIRRFFYDMRHTTDLVILMERSRVSERHYFYLRQKKIIADILRYHGELQENFLHVAILTYATDVTVVVDGINNSLNKCNLFEPEGYWDQVQFNTDPSQDGPSRIDLAFNETIRIFKDSQREGQAKRIVFVVSDGTYDSFPEVERNQLIGPYGATIYAMSTGYLAKDNVAQVQALATDTFFYGSDKDWLMATRLITPFIEATLVPYVNVPDTVGIIDMEDCDRGVLCDVLSGNYICRDQRNDGPCSEVSCQNGGTCVGTSQHFICWCKWGFSGRYCEVDEDDCHADPPMCNNGGKCVDHVGSFSCDCHSSLGCGCFCEDSCQGYFMTPTVPVIGEVVGVDHTNSIIWYALAGAGMALLLILIIVIAACRRREAKRSNVGIDNTEYFHINLAQVIPAPSSDDPPSPHPAPAAPSLPLPPIPPPSYSTKPRPSREDHLADLACAPERSGANSKGKQRLVQSTPEKLNLPEPEVSESHPQDMKITYM